MFQAAPEVDAVRVREALAVEQIEVEPVTIPRPADVVEDFAPEVETTTQAAPADVIEETDAPEVSAVPTLWDAFTQKYPDDARRILPSFEAANQCAATWENLTKYRLQSFVNYLAERLAPNSVHQYCTKFKAVLNLYSESVCLPRDFARVLTPRKQPTTKVWITEEELTRLAEFEPKTETEKLVRDQFLIGCYTGARHSDFIRFDETNIVGDTLSYVSQKTKIHAVVPLSNTARKLLHEKEDRVITERGFNNCIRRICKKCGINSTVKVFRAGRDCVGEKWEFVSSHTARRSFATNLYLRGVDIYAIARMLGHSSVEQTAQNYIVCGLGTLSSEAMGYFEN